MPPLTLWAVSALLACSLSVGDLREAWYLHGADKHLGVPMPQALDGLQSCKPQGCPGIAKLHQQSDEDILRQGSRLCMLCKQARLQQCLDRRQSQTSRSADILCWVHQEGRHETARFNGIRQSNTTITCSGCSRGRSFHSLQGFKDNSCMSSATETQTAKRSIKIDSHVCPRSSAKSTRIVGSCVISDTICARIIATIVSSGTIYTRIFSTIVSGPNNVNAPSVIYSSTIPFSFAFLRAAYLPDCTLGRGLFWSFCWRRCAHHN
mmetsp:Transcript_15151/g.43274  ORF Transcript_15151/g.43274 Transcript_15151/m.43274 type:complete len:264 (+) Transcript_15151:823-1614(+)